MALLTCLVWIRFLKILTLQLWLTYPCICLLLYLQSNFLTIWLSLFYFSSVFWMLCDGFLFVGRCMYSRMSVSILCRKFMQKLDLYEHHWYYRKWQKTWKAQHAQRTNRKQQILNALYPEYGESCEINDNSRRSAIKTVKAYISLENSQWIHKKKRRERRIFKSKRCLDLSSRQDNS